MTLQPALWAWNWRKAAALFAVFSVLALLLLHPVAPIAPLLAAVVLLPVVLFGLVAVPRSLWPAADLNSLAVIPVRARAHLFQRPPPNSLR
jgi:hypothetical protein